MKFKSKINFLGALIHILLTLIGLALVAYGFISVSAGGNALLTILSVLAGALFFMYSATPLLSTYYQIQDHVIFVKYGINKEEVPLKFLLKVEHVKKVFALNCLSTKRLCLTYREENDLKKVYMSPKNEEEFIKQLKMKCKSLKIEK